MWVLKRKEDGKYVSKIIYYFPYTASLRIAEKYNSKEEAVEKRFSEGDEPIQIDPYDYFKRGKE